MGETAQTESVRVVKRKWDRSISAVDTARPMVVRDGRSVWMVPAGANRARGGSTTPELVDSDELWVAVPGEWWVLCAYTDADRRLIGYKVHATAPFVAPSSEVEIEWIDLDLDFEVTGDEVALEDEAQFHEHARTMGYPSYVVRGAWSGISTVGARYTNSEWPFDGSLQEWLDSAPRD